MTYKAFRAIRALKKDPMANLLVAYTQLLASWRRTDLAGFVRDHERLYDEARRSGDHSEVAQSYYRIMAPMLETYYGDGWHFAPPERRGQSREDATRALHGRIAGLLQHGPGKRALDVGCGIGGTMRAIALQTGGEVVGISIGQNEVDEANALNRKAGLAGLCEVHQGDAARLPFPGESFDSVYAVYSFKYVVELKQAFDEIVRVLRPGGRFLLYDLVKTEAYDPDDPQHVRLIGGLEYSTGMPPLHSNAQRIAEAALSGLECVCDMDIAQQHPWYDQFARPAALPALLRSRAMRACIRGAERIGALPAGFTPFYDVFLAGTILSILNAGRLGILTGSSMLILRKPETS